MARPLHYATAMKLLSCAMAGLLLSAVAALSACSSQDDEFECDTRLRTDRADIPLPASRALSFLIDRCRLDQDACRDLCSNLRTGEIYLLEGFVGPRRSLSNANPGFAIPRPRPCAVALYSDRVEITISEADSFSCETPDVFE